MERTFGLVISLSLAALASVTSCGKNSHQALRQREGLRVGIDDTKVAWWAPATGEWRGEFGDFYAYGFHALRDWLKRTSAECTVIRGNLTDDALRNLDLLVIKMPEQEYEQREVNVVRHWVEQGGRLLVLGDHTNLLHATTIVNDLLEFSGLRCGYDHVTSDGHGGVTTAHALWEQPGRERYVDGLMSGCSVRGRGVVLLTVRDAIVTEWDPAGRSHFAEDATATTVRHGDAAVAMGAPWGAGAVVIVGDSTMLSSFAIHKAERRRLLEYLIACSEPAWLSRMSTLQSHSRAMRVWTAAALIACILAWKWHRVIRRVFGIAVVVGCWGFGTNELAMSCSLRSGALPKGVSVWRVRAVGGPAYVPDSIGGHRLDPAECFDGLTFALVRTGAPVELRGRPAERDAAFVIATGEATGADVVATTNALPCSSLVLVNGQVVLWRVLAGLKELGWKCTEYERWHSKGGHAHAFAYECVNQSNRLIVGSIIWGCSDKEMPHPMSVPSYGQEVSVRFVMELAGSML